MTPRQLLESASNEDFPDQDGTTYRILTGKALSDQDIAKLEQAVGHHLPPNVAELVRHAKGFAMRDREFDFANRFQWAPLDKAFPCAIWLSQADALDDWFIEINRQTGDWGPVYFFSHDPAVFVYAFNGLADFLASWFESARGSESTRLDFARLARFTVWNRQGPMRWAGELTESLDPILRAFARQLKPDHLIADLRSRTPGVGVRGVGETCGSRDMRMSWCSQFAPAGSGDYFGGGLASRANDQVQVDRFMPVSP